MYYDRRTGTYFTVPQPPKAYKITGKYGKTITPEELRENYDYSVEWGYTDENFDTWRTQLLRQGKIKAIY
jgi:hypothetical protein